MSGRLQMHLDVGVVVSLYQQSSCMYRGGGNGRSKVEKTHFSNSFGEVTDKRVVYYRKKGWFCGGSREDIPLSSNISTYRYVFVVY